jgi:hypothetical protein
LQAAFVFLFAVAVSKRAPWYIIPAYPFLSIFLAAWLWPSGQLDNGVASGDSAAQRSINAASGLRPLWQDGPAGALALSLLLWLSVGATTLNPFAYRSPVLPVRLCWRSLPGIPSLTGVLLTFGLLIGLTIVTRRLWPGGWKRFARPSLAALLVAAASFRILYPLSYTDHVSEMERLADRLAADTAAGQPLPERIPIIDQDKWDFFLGDRYRLWGYRDEQGKHYWLIRRDQPYPPLREEGMGDGRASPMRTDLRNDRSARHGRDKPGAGQASAHPSAGQGPAGRTSIRK